jgi:hypothetical protein
MRNLENCKSFSLVVANVAVGETKFHFFFSAVGVFLLSAKKE